MKTVNEIQLKLNAIKERELSLEHRSAAGRPVSGSVARHPQGTRGLADPV